jgi:hypothetical protein
MRVSCEKFGCAKLRHFLGFCTWGPIFPYNHLAQAGWSMQCNQTQLDVLRLRGQAAQRRSEELVRDCNVLMKTTPASRTFGAQYDFVARKGRSMLNWAVDSALRVTNATKGNLQVFDSSSRDLHIVAQRGFGQPFLDFFASVHTGQAACGKAFETCARVMVEDVAESPIFHATPSLEVLLDARVRAVQSTPLVSSSGAILGMLSTHWTFPRRLRSGELARLDVLAWTVTRWLEHNPFSG